MIAAGGYLADMGDFVKVGAAVGLLVGAVVAAVCWGSTAAGPVVAGFDCDVGHCGGFGLGGGDAVADTAADRTGSRTGRRGVWCFRGGEFGLGAGIFGGATTAAADLDELRGGVWSVVAAGAVTLGALALLAVKVPVGKSVWRQPVAAATCLVALAIVVGAGIAGADRQSVRVSRAGQQVVDASNAPAVAGGVPLARPTKVAWNYQAPSGIAQVRSSVDGAIVVLADGVVAVGGRDGRPRWHYRRGDGKVDRTLTTPDHRLLLLCSARKPVRGDLNSLVVLDTATGQLRSVQPVSGPDAAASFGPGKGTGEDLSDRLTNTTYATWSDDNQSVVVRDLLDRSVLWSKTLPADCTRTTSTATADTFVLDMRCPGATRDTLVGYPDRTGVVTWQKTFDRPKGGQVGLESNDGGWVTVGSVGDRDAIEVVLAASSGNYAYSSSMEIVSAVTSAGVLLYLDDGKYAWYDLASRQRHNIPKGQFGSCLDPDAYREARALRVSGGSISCATGSNDHSTTVSVFDLLTLRSQATFTVPGSGTHLVTVPAAVAFSPQGSETSSAWGELTTADAGTQHTGQYEVCVDAADRIAESAGRPWSTGVRGRKVARGSDKTRVRRQR
ncbi:hypothetical protein [Fodinicola feengrottensis]|uniref:hypothetical protein n=1 Tax=Fodinicola feengrottensis TaxID=435914 RepID=UPI002441B984|nr:hypothetical protein [Fodinicola feengrottensis]